MRPVITFTTDFGPSAPAVCRAVMFRFCPDANIIDISHQVPRYSIRDGAGTLLFAGAKKDLALRVRKDDRGLVAAFRDDISAFCELPLEVN